MTPHASDPFATDPAFLRHWQAEAVRLREAHWGPLDDGAAMRVALQGPKNLGERILLRAGFLAHDNGLRQHLIHWSASARIAAALLWLLALFAGIGMATAALGSGAAPVNLATALLAILGLHLVTLLIWLLSFFPGASPSSYLSQFWLWLSTRLARGPDAGLAAQALSSLLGRARAWRHVLGSLSHITWVIAFIGALFTLLIMLSTRRYSFQWETTLLTPEAFVSMAHFVGAVPAWLGFPIPDSSAITRSDGQHALPAAIQADWSAWLIGCVLVWGLLPRLIAALACVLIVRQRLHRIAVDPDLPGWMELRERLIPQQETLGIDAPAPAPAARAHWETPTPASLAGAQAILGFELGPDTPWPPADLPTGIRDMGLCDSRDDRRRTLDQLRQPPARLLLACDARQTPDRGTRAWLADLQSLCPQLDVLLLHGPGRTPIWREILDAQGLHITPSLSDWAHVAPIPKS